MLRTEGDDNGEWIIVDCGAAVAHIMQPAIRDYYRLEEIWGGKPVKLKLGTAQSAGCPRPRAEPARKKGRDGGAGERRRRVQAAEAARRAGRKPGEGKRQPRGAGGRAHQQKPTPRKAAVERAPAATQGRAAQGGAAQGDRGAPTRSAVGWSSSPSASASRPGRDAAYDDYAKRFPPELGSSSGGQGRAAQRRQDARRR